MCLSTAIMHWPSDERSLKPLRSAISGAGERRRRSGSFRGSLHWSTRAETGRPSTPKRFAEFQALIDGTDPEVPELEASLAPLRRGVELVEQGRITRSLISDRLGSLHRAACRGRRRRSTGVVCPRIQRSHFGQGCLLAAGPRSMGRRANLPRLRRAEDGWFHDLYFPGYLWADTEGEMARPRADVPRRDEQLRPRQSSAWSPPSSSCSGRRPHSDSGLWVERRCRLATNSKAGSRWSADSSASRGTLRSAKYRPIEWRRHSRGRYNGLRALSGARNPRLSR